MMTKLMKKPLTLRLAGLAGLNPVSPNPPVVSAATKLLLKKPISISPALRLAGLAGLAG
jgi:hypothetical protein